MLMAPEVVICDDMAEELEKSPARAFYPAVRLRFKGEQVAVKAEALPCALIAVAARDDAEEVKALKKKLWHAARERTKLRLSCEGAIRGIKFSVKTESRGEAMKALAAVPLEMDSAGALLRRLQRDNKTLRKAVYKHDRTRSTI